MHLKKFDIRLTVLFVLTTVLSITSFQAQAQLLAPHQQRGTVREQLQRTTYSDNPIVDELLSYAFRFQGTPYRYGCSSPRGFDCSGFTSYVFKRFGVHLDRSSGGQIKNGRRIARNDVQPGDLVFFGGRAGRGRIGHVGIVTRVNSDNTFHFIHSACHKGVTESKITEPYYSRRYMGACRVLE